MNDLTSFLKDLISLPGLTGHEAPVRRKIAATWKPWVDELSVSRIGSLHGLRRGAGLEPRPSLLLATHMDAIGLMVAGQYGEFLSVVSVGGLDPRVLPGQLVTVHGRQDLPGVIAQPAAHLLPPGVSDHPVPIAHLLVDVGLTEAEVTRLVRAGDLVSFAQPPIEMEGGLLVGHSLDNRASVAALTGCLEQLQGRATAWDVWAVATVQEEETLGGAMTSAFQLHPSLAVAIDVTYGAAWGSPGHGTFPLGEGVTLGWGPNIHPALYHAFEKLAEELEIPYAMEPMPRSSGTDAIAMQVAAEGIPTMVVSIPLRSMHTPVEMVAMRDVQRTARLLAEFVARLTPDFMEQIAWEE